MICCYAEMRRICRPPLGYRWQLRLTLVMGSTLLGCWRGILGVTQLTITHPICVPDRCEYCNASRAYRKAEIRA
jgi:hypothetical protein